MGTVTTRGGKVGDQRSYTLSVDRRGDKWLLDGLFPLLSAPLIRCCQLGHSYLRSTFTPRSGWRGKRQQPTKALSEDEFRKDKVLKDLHLLTKKLKPQTNALRRRPAQTGMSLVGVLVLFSLSLNQQSWCIVLYSHRHPNPTVWSVV